MLIFLSKSGRQISLRVTISLEVNFPDKVLNDFVSASVFGTTTFGKADLLIKHPVEPESNITWSSLRLRTHKIVLAVQIVAGVSFLGEETLGTF